MADKVENKKIYPSGCIVDESYFKVEVANNLVKQNEQNNDSNYTPYERESYNDKEVEVTGQEIKEEIILSNIKEEVTDDSCFKDPEWEILKQYYKEERILESIIYAIEPDKKTGEINFITEFNSVERIVIPDNQFFYTEMLWSDFNVATPQEKFKRKYNMACTFIGARVTFVLTRIHKQMQKNGTIEYFVDASRIKARDIMLKYYFFARRGSRVKVGDLVYPKIMSLNRVWARVEVFGVETNMNIETLSSTKWIKDCTKEFRVGQKIDAIVTKLTVDKETKEVKIGLSRKLLPRGSLDKIDLTKISIGTIIMGEVVNYNSEKGIATAVLRGEILCAIPQKNFIGGKRLYPGDKISAIITEIKQKEGYVIASAKPLLTKYEE